MDSLDKVRLLTNNLNYSHISLLTQTKTAEASESLSYSLRPFHNRQLISNTQTSPNRTTDRTRSHTKSQTPAPVPQFPALSTFSFEVADESVKVNKERGESFFGGFIKSNPSAGQT